MHRCLPPLSWMRPSRGAGCKRAKQAYESSLINMGIDHNNARPAAAFLAGERLPCPA
jgi:hypothetical protein